MHWINIKSITAIVAAAIAAGTGTHLLQQREANRLRSENQNLVAQQEQLITERDTAWSAVSQKHDDVEQFQKEKSELLKLRGEVGVLRKQVVEIEKLQEENKKLRASFPNKLQPNGQKRLANVIYKADNHFPKEAWAFAGYDSPEAAIATWIWALNKGDKAGILASLSPEAETQWQKILESTRGSDLAAKSPFAAYTLISQEIVSDNEVAISIVNDYPDGKKTGEQKMKIVKIGSDWKIAGPAKE